MAYKIDKHLQAGLDLMETNDKGNYKKAMKLINKSAQSGETKGKSYFFIAKILREGLLGFDPDIETSKNYYDAAMGLFDKEVCDSLDHKMMGDYYNYGLGTKAIDKNRALDFYDMAAEEGDEEAKTKAEEIRSHQMKGTPVAAPTLSPKTEVKVEEVKPVEEKPRVERRVVEVAQAPIVSSENREYETDDPTLLDVIDAEQATIKVIRLLDAPTSTRQDKLDAIEMAKDAAEHGSVRSAVLVGYLYEGDNSLVQKDYEMADKYYKMAVDKGSATALFRLGILYTDKDAPFYDIRKGHEMIIASARKGYVWALMYIGDCFRQKVVDDRNLELAYRYYCLAGERGLGLGYHFMSEIDASRQQLSLSIDHERMAIDNGYDPAMGYQDPLFYTLHI